MGRCTNILPSTAKPVPTEILRLLVKWVSKKITLPLSATEAHAVLLHAPNSISLDQVLRQLCAMAGDALLKMTGTNAATNVNLALRAFVPVTRM